MLYTARAKRMPTIHLRLGLRCAVVVRGAFPPSAVRQRFCGDFLDFRVARRQPGRLANRKVCFPGFHPAMRKSLFLAVRVMVTGALLYISLRLVDAGTVRDRLQQADASWLALGFVLLLIQAWLCAARWELIVTRCGARLTLPRSFRYIMIAAFFNQTLPSSVGGDAIRVWLVGKHANWRVAAYSVLLDRIVGVVALAGLVVLGLPWTFALVRDPVGRVALLIIGFGCIAAGLVFVALAWKHLRVLQRWLLTRHLAAAATVAVDILRTPAAGMPIASLSVAIHVFTVLVAWCAARSIGASVPIMYLFFVILPVVLVATVPVSIAGWGVREGAMVTTFAYAGLPQGDGLAISLLFGILYLLLGVAGGAVWIFSHDRRDPTAMSPLPSVEI